MRVDAEIRDQAESVLAEANVSDRSRQCGFPETTNASFFFLDPLLICYSRAIAAVTSCVCSK